MILLIILIFAMLAAERRSEMGIARAVFDSAMALDSRKEDPAGYFRMLEKKIGKLRAAAEAFRTCPHPVRSQLDASASFVHRLLSLVVP